MTMNSPSLSNERGIFAMKVSMAGLMITAVLQVVVVYFSGSVALMADTVHNFMDAFSSVPLWIVFALERQKPNRRFTYGYSRLEDIAGMFIVVLIFATAGAIGYESYRKLTLGLAPDHLLWVGVAAVVGYLGNEGVARYKIKVGREINSAALIADGQHSRADGVTSLSVLAGVIGVYFGFPLADPLVGFLIALFILYLGWDTGKTIFSRLADAISPETIETIKKEAEQVDGVLGVHDVRARLAGRHLRVDLTIEVNNQLTVLQGHEIAIQVQHRLQTKLPILESPMIHVDPKGHTGEAHHFEAHHKV